MSADWPTLSLREAGVSLIDCEHRTPPAAASGYPYIAIPQIRAGRIHLAEARRITQDHFAEWTRKARPRDHDVVLSRRCNPGETGYVEVGMEFALGQNLVILRADGRVVFPPFLRWLVRGPGWWEQIGKFLNVGAVFDSLKCADVPKFQLPIPPLPLQRLIAETLGSLDDKISLNRRMNETLEAMARAVFQSWFVNFDPVRVKADGRKPDGLDAATAKLFPDTFEESPLGPIPKGWRVGCVSDIAETNAWTVSKADHLPHIDYVEISEVSRGQVGAVVRYERGSEPSRARRRVRNGDTILSTVRPDRGAYFLAINPAESLIVSTGFAVLTPRSPHWSFLHSVVTQEEFGVELGRLADGGAYPAVRPELIAAQPVVIPNESVEAAFHRATEKLFLLAAENRKQSAMLAEIRDALLPKLLSGEVALD
jgi:type I restriction enzyme S subunit